MTPIPTTATATELWNSLRKRNKNWKPLAGPRATSRSDELSTPQYFQHQMNAI